MEASDVTDEMLTAFLDGETDQVRSSQLEALIARDDALAARLDRLQVPMPAIRKAFDLAKDAAPPLDLAVLMAARQGPKEPARNRWRAITAVAACLLAFVAGMALDRVAGTPDSSQDWRVAVAEYQRLYALETLDIVQTTAAERLQSAKRAASGVGAPITGTVLDAIDKLDFKRAQLLRWQDAPLAQFAFLSDSGLPFALCAMGTDQEDRPVETSLLRGLASSSWVKDGTAYILIGGEDKGFVGGIADKLHGAL